MAIISAIRAYFSDCPLLTSGAPLGVDFLGDGVGYTVDAYPCDPIYRRYTDGGTIRQFLFDFASREKFGTKTAENMRNSQFYDRLATWVEQKNLGGTYPELDDGLTPIEMFVVSRGYVEDSGDNTARYVMQFRLLYYQPGYYKTEVS